MLRVRLQPQTETHLRRSDHTLLGRTNTWRSRRQYIEANSRLFNRPDACNSRQRCIHPTLKAARPSLPPVSSAPYLAAVRLPPGRSSASRGRPDTASTQWIRLLYGGIGRNLRPFGERHDRPFDGLTPSTDRPSGRTPPPARPSPRAASRTRRSRDPTRSRRAVPSARTRARGRAPCGARARPT